MEELILKERETKEKLVELINDSGLPAILLKPMIKDMLEQLSILEQNQYIQAQQLKGEKEDKEDKEEKEE